MQDFRQIPFQEFETTLGLIAEYCSAAKYTSIGISSFGPICLVKSSEKFGEILSGACEIKKTWLGKSLALRLGGILGVGLNSINVETDVNGACFAEIVASKLLNEKEFEISGENWAYITVGTGVGVGLVNTKIMRGAFGGFAGHPEGGHIM